MPDPTRPAWVTLGALSIHNALVAAGTHPWPVEMPSEVRPPEGAVRVEDAHPTVAPCDWCVRVWTDACEAARAGVLQRGRLLPPLDYTTWRSRDWGEGDCMELGSAIAADIRAAGEREEAEAFYGGPMPRGRIR